MKFARRAFAATTAAGTFWYHAHHGLLDGRQSGLVLTA